MINAKRTSETLAANLKDDATILKDFGLITTFLTTAAMVSDPTGGALLGTILGVAGSAISAGTRIVDRLGDEGSTAVRALPHTYERFRVLFYTVCQRSYLEALRDSGPIKRLAKSNKTEVDVTRIAKSFGEAAARLSEAEVRFHYSIDPADGSLPLYEEYTSWLQAALGAVVPAHEAANIAAGVEEEARKALRTTLSTASPAADWMRNYLVLDFQSQAHDSLEDIQVSMARLEETLKSWTRPWTGGGEPQRTDWESYRTVLHELPHRKESMYDEDFGVSKVFVSPEVSYHRAGVHGSCENPQTVPDVWKLLGALISTRVPGDDLVFICGGPGSGKSTLCVMLAAHLAKNPDFHPVFLKLRRCKEGAELSSFVEDSLRKEGVINRLSDLRSLPNVVIILDGFDEIVLASRTRLRHFFTVLVDDLRNGPLRTAKVIVSGRDTLFRSGKGLPRGSHVLAVLPFAKPRVSAWGGKWRDLHPDGAGCSFTPEVLLHDLASADHDDALRQLVSWPLTLHLLARLHTSGLFNVTEAGASTVEKAYLYRAILHQTADRQSELATGKGRLEPEVMRRFLRAVAFEMYCRSVDAMAVSDVVPLAGKFFAGQDEVAMSDLAEVAIVNSPEIQKGADTGFEFVHKSFAEFLVAETLAETIQTVCHRVSDITGAEVWHKSIDEAATVWSATFSGRVIPSEVQEMLEPMLGVFIEFQRGSLVNDSVGGETVSEGLRRVLLRCVDLYEDFTMHRSLIHSVGVGTRMRTSADEDPLLGRLACVGTNIVLVGAAVSRRLRRDARSEAGGARFCLEPFTGAIWRWLSLVHAGGVRIEAELAERLYDGCEVPSEVGDTDFPIRLGHLAGVAGYRTDLRVAVDTLQSCTMAVTEELIYLALALDERGRRSPGRLSGRGRGGGERRRAGVQHLAGHAVDVMISAFVELEKQLLHIGAVSPAAPLRDSEVSRHYHREAIFRAGTRTPARSRPRRYGHSALGQVASDIAEMEHSELDALIDSVEEGFCGNPWGSPRLLKDAIARSNPHLPQLFGGGAGGQTRKRKRKRSTPAQSDLPLEVGGVQSGTKEKDE